MEKINDILKPLIGFLIIFSFIIAFSSCEQKPKQEVVYEDTVQEQKEERKEEQKQTEDSISWKTRVEQEGKEIDASFESLKAKAKVKGKKAEKDVNQEIEKLNKERKDIVNSNADDSAKEKWEKFKEKTKAVVDSLDKKI